MPNEEKVNHPAHYQGKHECIDEMIALNGPEDIAKAEWYMDKLMELNGDPLKVAGFVDDGR